MSIVVEVRPRNRITAMQLLEGFDGNATRNRAHMTEWLTKNKVPHFIDNVIDRESVWVQAGGRDSGQERVLPGMWVVLTHSGPVVMTDSLFRFMYEEVKSRNERQNQENDLRGDRAQCFGSGPAGNLLPVRMPDACQDAQMSRPISRGELEAELDHTPFVELSVETQDAILNKLVEVGVISSDQMRPDFRWLTMREKDDEVKEP